MTPRFGDYDDIQVLKVEVNRLIDLLAKGPPAPSSGWQPPVDVCECEDAVVVRIDVPGVRTGNLEVRLHKRLLEVRGTKRRLASEPTARRFHLMERFMGPFRLTVGLPADVDRDRVSASLSNGLLTVTLPRLEVRPEEPQRIAVREEADGHE